MSKVYIVARGNCEGIQGILSVHRSRASAVTAFKRACDELILELEGHINYELDRNPDHRRWIERWENQIEALKTYNEEIISDRLYPNEAPVILESELLR